ncbi:MAG TPA: FemAB family XrtA/PEP-CTERM system-associated protein [Rhizomicrobium sp.]|jgi:FemAB-related protein (PEP-CTERM system-associated)|nr:FemAB family XrtA/PEP-CTERM system-associated protein [Rhizomicrobium sp.]
MSDIRIALIEPDDATAWDEFVRSAPSATFFHLSGWKPIIEKAFGHETYYLLAKRGGAVVGLLPLTHIKSFIFGNSLISNAFSVYGGIVSSDAEAHGALVGAAADIARRLKVDCVEFRSIQPSNPSWVQRDGLYVTFRRPIGANSDENMKAIPRKQRAMIRKGISNGLTSECDENPDRLHEIYAHSVHHLGTPVFPLRYFQLLKEQFGDACDIVTVVQGACAVASVMNFYFRDEVLPYYGGGTNAARKLAANDFMYWEVMRRAAERGCRVFDFGRSKVGTGSYNFKRYWGFEPQPLSYEFLPVGASKLPDNNPLNPKFQLFVSAWRRLPFFATKLLGPLIVRSIG